MAYYEIKDWNRIFENAESRKYKKLNWVPVPNKWDGLGFSRLRKHKNFVVAYCGWSLIVQIASKMPQRGILVTADGWELSPVDMADLTGCPEDVFSKALEVLCTPEIGWIIRKDSENLPVSPETAGESPSVSGDSSVEQNRTEREQKEGEKSASAPPPPPASGGLGKDNEAENRRNGELAKGEQSRKSEKWEQLYDPGINEPTAKEVQAYAESIGYAMTDDEAQRFIDTNQAAGWMNKHGNALRDWRPLVRIWKSNASKFAPKNSGKIVPLVFGGRGV